MKKYIRCNSCSHVQQFSEEVEKCELCESGDIQVFETEMDMINEAEILITESELNFLFDYKEPESFNKDDRTCWFDVYLIKDFKDNTKIKFALIQNQVSREEDLMIMIRGNKIEPKVIQNNQEIKARLSEADENSETVHFRFLSRYSTKRKEYDNLFQIDNYVFENKNKDNLNNDMILRNLYLVLSDMGNRLFYNNEEEIRVNKVFTEFNFLNSPLFKEQETLAYRDTKAFNQYNSNDIKYRVKEAIENFNLENELDVFNYLYNKSNNENSKKEYADNKEIFYSLTPSMLLDEKMHKEDNEHRVNPNVLSLMYFEILKYKANIADLELNIATSKETEAIKILPLSYNGQGYVLADFDLDSPIVFGSLEDAEKYIRFKIDGYEVTFAIKELPNYIDLTKNISNDEQIIDQLFRDNEKLYDLNLNEYILENFSVLNEAASTNKEKRQEIQNLILNVISSLDKDQSNMRKYKAFYDEMNDEQFMRYIKRFVNSDENFYIEFLPNKNEPGLNDIEDALNKLDVPMNEFVYYRHDGNKDNPIRTRYTVPVG